MSPPSRVAAVVLSMAFALPVAAAEKSELFKCVDAAGAISIQSTPCAKGSTQAWRRDATPEPAPTPEQAAQAQAKVERDQRAVRELSQEVERKLKPPSQPSQAESTRPVRSDEDGPEPVVVDAPDRCAQAQDFAAQLREKTWLQLSDDQVRRLYAWVATQCQPVKPEQP